ncbi:hypothetical protein MXB_4776 [Myxobolus squamalis]|nr:hypothetical protein MXB_4776 [Myxobolus squamalis]
MEWIFERGKIVKENHQILLWLPDDALCLLQANNLCLIDRTYQITPHPFYQALVIMNFDRVTSCFVPCILALLNRSGECLYFGLFHKIFAMLDWVWEPEAIFCDFEQGLLKALQQEFLESQGSGFYSH